MTSLLFHHKILKSRSMLSDACRESFGLVGGPIVWSVFIPPPPYPPPTPTPTPPPPLQPADIEYQGDIYLGAYLQITTPRVGLQPVAVFSFSCKPADYHWVTDSHHIVNSAQASLHNTFPFWWKCPNYLSKHPKYLTTSEANCFSCHWHVDICHQGSMLFRHQMQLVWLVRLVSQKI